MRGWSVLAADGTCVRFIEECISAFAYSLIDIIDMTGAYISRWKYCFLTDNFKCGDDDVSDCRFFFCDIQSSLENSIKLIIIIPGSQSPYV